MNNIKELRSETTKDLKTKLNNYRKESLNLRFQKTSGQLENTARISKVKKEIARIKTVLNEESNKESRKDPNKELKKDLKVSAKKDIKKDLKVSVKKDIKKEKKV